MSERARLALAMGLCALIWIGFDLAQPPRPPPESVVDPAAASADPAEPKAPWDPASPDPAAPREPEVAAAGAVPEARAVLSTDELELEVANTSLDREGLIARSRLTGERFRGHAEADDWLNLGDRRTLEVSFADEATDFRIPRGTNFALRSEGESTVVASYEAADVAIEERLELVRGYEGRLTVAVTNRSAAGQQHRLHLRLRLGELGEASQYDIHRGLCRTAESLEYEDGSDVEDGAIPYPGPIRWGGVDSKFFLAAVIPERDLARCEIAAEDDGRYLVVTLSAEPVLLEPGETRRHVFGVFLGAKLLEDLERFSAVERPDVELHQAIDWGVFGGLSESLGRLLLVLMRWFYGLTGIWGVAIVLLTVLVKVLTLPLTLKQMSSMKRMKEIQPEITRIREKYADDRVKQGQEMQALFSRTGVRPLAGCLPMVVQLPIWFALYSMLNTAVELVHVSFLWLPDLTKQDPYFILPLALGGLMIVQNRMMPTSGMDPAQAKMMQWMMPIVFTFFMLFMPSGLALYILANIVLGLIQTAIQLRSSKPSAAAT